MTSVGGREKKKVKTCSIMVGGGGGGRDFVTAPKTMFLVVVQEDGETKRIRTLFFSVAKRGSLYLVSR